MSQLVYIPIKAIIFDFDGTLVDTKRYYFELAAEYLQVEPEKLIAIANENCFSKLSPKDRNVRLKIVRAVYESARIFGFNRIRAMKAVNFLRLKHNSQFSRAKPTKDALIALKRLKASDIRLAIISFTSRRKIEIFLKKHLRGSNYFSTDHILARGEYKNKELAIVHFLRKFNLTDFPQSCAIVGDLGGDTLAGKTIGITTFGITTGYSTREILEVNNPDAIYDSLLEMEKAIHLFLVKEE